jgi:hypothetical protein
MSVTYIHRETFNIYVICDEYFAEGEENPDYPYEKYFIVEDLMALPIQALNRKGYLTKQCCSGHLYSETPSGEWPIIYKIDSGDTSRFQARGLCITFESGISLPSLPPGFTALYATSDIDYMQIDWDSDKVNTYYEAHREILEVIELLYKWILSLPDFKS